MLTRGGSPTWIAPPASVSPFRKRLRDNRERLVITLDTGKSSLRRELPRDHHRDYHIFKLEAGFTEIFKNPSDRALVRGGIAAAGHVPEILPHDAFLALRAVRQHRSKLFRRR